jgi:hypothetical protein
VRMIGTDLTSVVGVDFGLVRLFVFLARAV